MNVFNNVSKPPAADGVPGNHSAIINNTENTKRAGAVLGFFVVIQGDDPGFYAVGVFGDVADIVDVFNGIGALGGFNDS